MDLRSRIPSGPEDAPVLLTRGSALEFDVDDVDGRLFMLDRDFGGTATAAFSKPMDPSVAGVVTIDGEPADYVLKQLTVGGGRWVLGVKAFGRLLDPGAEHVLHVEGFSDTDGNVIAPTSLAIVTAPRREPEPEFAEHE